MNAPKSVHSNQKRRDRRSQRRPVSLQGHIVRAGGISRVIELVDLNNGGCGIEVCTELTPGELVTLSVLGRGSIPAQVRWFSDGRAGLDFSDSINAGPKEIVRSTERLPLIAEVSLRAPGRNSYRVRVLDISIDGCSVELVERPNVGDTMLVKIEGLEALEANVCWVEGHRAGLMFANQMHPAVLDLLIQRLSND